MAMKKYASLEEYQADLEGPALSHIKNMVKIVEESAPELERTFAYGYPTYKLNGRTVLHFIAAQKHLGFFPGPGAVSEFKNKLDGFFAEKGTIQFPYDQALPDAIIKDILKFNLNNIK